MKLSTACAIINTALVCAVVAITWMGLEYKDSWHGLWSILILFFTFNVETKRSSD